MTPLLARTFQASAPARMYACPAPREKWRTCYRDGGGGTTCNRTSGKHFAQTNVASTFMALTPGWYESDLQSYLQAGGCPEASAYSFPSYLLSPATALHPQGARDQREMPVSNCHWPRQDLLMLLKDTLSHYCGIVGLRRLQLISFCVPNGGESSIEKKNKKGEKKKSICALFF